MYVFCYQHVKPCLHTTKEKGLVRSYCSTYWHDKSSFLRFPRMKRHVGMGLGFKMGMTHGLEHDGRYLLFARNQALQNRWNKLSRAIRRGECSYFFSHYNDCGQYCVSRVTDFRTDHDVSLINDKDKTRKQKFRRTLDTWNGPLGNGIRKLQEESLRREVTEREAKQIAMKMDNTFLETSMHGFWYGSVDNLKYEVAPVKCLPRPTQMFGDGRYLLSVTPPLDRLNVVLQVQTNLASTLPVVKNIWNEGAPLAFLRARSGSFFWLRRSSPNPSLRVAMQRAIVDCTGLVFTAATSYLCAKRHKDDCLT